MTMILTVTTNTTTTTTTYFKVGQNIICRVGDPCKLGDLMKVNAHRASSIMLMMTDYDAEERDRSNEQSINGCTLRTVLALRHVLFSTNILDKTLQNMMAKMFGGAVKSYVKALTNETRIVIQLEQPSKLIIVKGLEPLLF